MSTLFAGYWFLCPACDNRKFYKQDETTVDDRYIPTVFDALEERELAWSYHTHQASDTFRRLCLECKGGIVARMYGTGHNYQSIISTCIATYGPDNGPEDHQPPLRDLMPHIYPQSLSYFPEDCESEGSDTPTQADFMPLTNPTGDWQHHHIQWESNHHSYAASAWPYHEPGMSYSTIEVGGFHTDPPAMAFDGIHPNVQPGYLVPDEYRSPTDYEQHGGW